LIGKDRYSLFVIRYLLLVTGHWSLVTGLHYFPLWYGHFITGYAIWQE